MIALPAQLMAVLMEIAHIQLKIAHARMILIVIMTIYAQIITAILLYCNVIKIIIIYLAMTQIARLLMILVPKGFVLENLYAVITASARMKQEKLALIALLTAEFAL